MKAKTSKIFLDGSGSFLGAAHGCITVRDRKGEVQKYPLFEDEIGEVILKSGNAISTGALATFCFWGIDCLILTQKGNPVGFLKAFDDDSHVETRIAQYESIKDGRGIEIAKKIVLARIEGQNSILRKYGLRQLDVMKAREIVKGIQSKELAAVRRKLLAVEGHLTDHYFHQIFQLLPKSMLTENRRTFKAFDGINNLFNLAYTILKWKAHRAVTKAKLEPFLGFLHSEAFGKPSLSCDLMELYRFMVDSFIIEYCRGLKERDFEFREERNGKRKGKREYLNKPMTSDLLRKLNAFFQTKVDIPRMNHGNRQEIETMINEEAQLLAKYLRGEKKEWAPRVPKI